MPYLTTDELLTVLQESRSHSIGDWTMILLAYRHGLRASEWCNLRLADLDMRSEAITVRRLIGSMLTIQPLYRHRGQKLLDEIGAIRTCLRERPNDGLNYVFTSQKGGRLDRTQFFRVFRTIAESAGLPLEKGDPHVLKHTLASHLIRGNVKLTLVRQALGHRSITSTIAYVSTTDGQAADAEQAALMNLV